MKPRTVKETAIVCGAGVLAPGDPRGALPLAKTQGTRLSLRRGRCLSAIGV